MATEKIVERKEVKYLCENLRRDGVYKFVFTNGVYDLTHVGHLRMLEKCSELGTILVVGVNSDASARLLGKGPDRPFVREGERAEMIAGFGCVDFVVVFDEPTPLELIEDVRPDVLCKGGDW